MENLTRELPRIATKIRTLQLARSSAFGVLIVILVVVGVVRIAATYRVFWQTWDEPAHIAAGMEWLDRGQFTYEPMHPPLARIMSALGPYLDGLRLTGNSDRWIEGNAILHSHNTYERNLSLARLGILPFFVFASMVVALWAYVCGGVHAAFPAVLLFTTLPAILAHAGLATLDMAAAAFVGAVLLALCLWFERPTLLRSLLLGIALGMSVLAKFSTLLLLVVPGGLIVVMFGFHYLRAPSGVEMGRQRVRSWVIAASTAVLVCLFVIWSGYRFSYRPLMTTEDRPHDIIDQVFGTTGPLTHTAYSFVESIYMPAPEFFRGIKHVVSRNNSGHVSYLLGEIRTHGWWYYFPLVLLLKTPLPFTVLCATGVCIGFKRVILSQAALREVTPAVAVLGVLFAGMLSSVDNGIRQLLAIYPVAAVAAGYGTSRLLRMHSSQYITVGLVGVLLFSQVTSSLATHPNYLAYFNVLAGNRPEEIVVDSDLDWGQDLKRLAATLKRRDIQEVTIIYNGSEGINFNQFQFPPWRHLNPYQKTTGWIAISVYKLKLGTGKHPYDQFAWLKEFEPVERIGTSIWLYYIPDT